jgi:TolA-binding protein
VDRLTRKELKSDRFALEVQHGVTYVNEHRQQMMRWGGIGLGALVLISGIVIYRNHEHSVRQEDLAAAMKIQNANIGPAQTEYQTTFPTAAERYKAVEKSFTDLSKKYSGSDEGEVAEFYLGTAAADQGRIDEAERHFKRIAEGGSSSYASLAKLSLAQIYATNGKVADGEKLLQSLIDKPTVMVSKEQATIALGELLAKTDPARARKLLEPLRNSKRSGVSRAAINALSDFPQK